MPSANFSHLVTNPKMKKVLEECGYIRSNTLGQHWELKPSDWHGCCTSGPTTFYKNGGIQLSWWGGAGPYKANVEQMRSSLKKCGMVEVFHCNLATAKEKFSRANAKINCRPGDIGSMLSASSAHGVMWTGEDWRSDCIEPDHPVPYRNNNGRGGDESFILWRHPDLQEPGVPIDGGALGNAPTGGAVSSSSGDGSWGSMVALNGISKYWYLGAAHNILNNTQLEKLYVDVKLRGCNLSLLKGEKVPVMLIDNKYKTNLAEPDAAHIDPTTMIDTWASGWFMIGGISYIYDPKNTGNANKWITHMKLQRMEWPTPVEVSDPSARNIRSLRYNLADGIDGINIDAGVTVEGTSINDQWKSKEIVVGTAGLDTCMKQLLKLFDTHKIRYKLVSARRYVINELGNIVKERVPANVKWQGSYAFKCADGVRFFRNPISDHSWGQGIDIIQADGTNFNKLLADIIDCDDILVFMYNNGLSLYEEQAIDDLGAATSHFHIGTNINLPTSSGNKAEDIITIGNNWWDGVAAIKGTNILKGYALSKWKNKKKASVTDTVPANKLWTLRKIFNDEENWQEKSFNSHEISYDDWIEKVQVNLKKEVALYNDEKDIKYIKIPSIAHGPDSSVVQTDTPGAYIPSIPKGAGDMTDQFSKPNVEQTTYNNFKLGNKELVNEEMWDTLGDECYSIYSQVERLFNNNIKTGKFDVSEAHFQDAITRLRECMGKIKVIIDNVNSSNLIQLLSKATNESESEIDYLYVDTLLIKRYNLETKYNNSKKLCSDIDRYMQVYNANHIRNLGSGEEGGTGVQTVTLLNTENTQKLSLDAIMKDIETCHQICTQEWNKIKNNIHHYKLSIGLWNDPMFGADLIKYPKLSDFLEDFLKKSGINSHDILICSPLSQVSKWLLPLEYIPELLGNEGISGALGSNNSDEMVSVFIYDNPGTDTNRKKWKDWVRKGCDPSKIIYEKYTEEYTNEPFMITLYDFPELMEKALLAFFEWFESRKKVFPGLVWKYNKLVNTGAFDNVSEKTWHNSGPYLLWFDLQSKGLIN